MTNATHRPSFIDLRAFAHHAATNAPTSTRSAVARVSLPAPDGPVEIFSLHFPTGGGKIAGEAGDLFLIGTGSGIAISAATRTVMLGDGAAVILTGGAGFEWSALEAATVIALRYPKAPGASDDVISIDPLVTLTPSGAPLAELLVGPTPACRNHTTYLSGDGEFMAGVWDSTPYHRLAMTYRHYELMYLLRGSVTFVDHVGNTRTFTQGDIFLVQQGASCSWESLEDVAKIYAIYRPAA